jgi:hypothetical protein
MKREKINSYRERFKTPEQRFWSRVDKSGGPDACWPWTAASFPRGYGCFRIGRGNPERRSNRCAWIFTHGPIPEGMLVCHKCDNPPCCNPSHLFLGTDLDNGRDKAKKGRGKAPRGENSHLSKLKTSEIIEIREKHASGKFTQRGLASMFNITISTVNRMLKRQLWNHI